MVMLLRLEFCAAILFISKLIAQSVGTTHWFVAQNGKIQSQCISAFGMNQPHDLLSFLNQEKLLRGANVLYQRALTKTATFDRQWIDFNIVASLDQKLYSMDNHPFSNQLLSDINFYTTIVTNSSLREEI